MEKGVVRIGTLAPCNSLLRYCSRGARRGLFLGVLSCCFALFAQVCAAGYGFGICRGCFGLLFSVVFSALCLGF